MEDSKAVVVGEEGVGGRTTGHCWGEGTLLVNTAGAQGYCFIVYVCLYMVFVFFFLRSLHFFFMYKDSTISFTG